MGYAPLCAPLLCGFIGIGRLSWGALLGHEFGVDLGLSYHPRSRGPEVAVTLRPVALANPQSRFRTKALLGVLLPEMRYRPGAPGLDLAFTPIPIDFKILETFQMALRASALLEEAGTKNRWRPALALEFAYAL